MEMMLGRSLGEMYPRWDSKPGEPMLVVEEPRGAADGAGFQSGRAARHGGLPRRARSAPARSKCLRALAGLAADATGEVRVAGQTMRLRSVAKAQAAKVQFISEDRAGEGMFLRLSVGANLVATRLSDHTRLGVLARQRLRATATQACLRRRRRPRATALARPMS